MKRKDLPPWSRHHQPWCAVFFGEPCDCDDDDRRKPKRQRPPPLRGGGTPLKQKQEELEEV
jgi:hypothetical protein